MFENEAQYFLKLNNLSLWTFSVQHGVKMRITFNVVQHGYITVTAWTDNELLNSSVLTVFTIKSTGLQFISTRRIVNHDFPPPVVLIMEENVQILPDPHLKSYFSLPIKCFKWRKTFQQNMLAFSITVNVLFIYMPHCFNQNKLVLM